MKLCVYTIVATILFLPPVLVVHAQTPCGNIVGPKNFVPDLSVQTVTLPIANCDDPFRVTSDPPSPYTLMVNDTEYPGGGTIGVPDGKTNQIRVKGNPELSSYNLLLYKHDGNDYRYVHMDAPEASRADFAEYAATYFESQATANKYMDIYDAFVDNGGADSFFYDENGNQIIDDWTSDPVSDRYSAFADSFYATFVPKRPFIESGTYTLFIKEYLLINTYRTPVQRFVDLIIPTAHAAPLNDAGYPENRYTITFTLTEAVPEPTGASSVLFLPGIMGSRLYEESDACDESENPVVTERQRWISLSECAQLRLSMNNTGISENNIYAKPGKSGVLVGAFGSDVYTAFFDALAEWKEQKIIKDYEAVPYDWRLGLNTLLKVQLDLNTGKINHFSGDTIQDGYLYKTLEKLAADSYTKKVTIVAHSNGGLLVKAFLATLERDNDPLADKVDNVILVAVPQVGTPDAVVGMLHGSRIIPFLSVFEVVSQQTSRQLLGNMPFAYHLLPGASYFNGPGVTVSTPVISFEPGSLTTSLGEKFGTTINSAEKMQDFMAKSSGREVPKIDDLNTPAVLNELLFGYAVSINLLVNSWVPASTTKVYEIAGTGLLTVSGISYYTGRECGFLNPKCLLFKPKIEYRVQHVVDGDETVVAPSALAMKDNNENINHVWLNLAKYNIETDSANNHGSILEIPEVLKFVKNKLQASTSVYDYITSEQPQINGGDRLDFSLHSPLDMSIILADGTIVSSSSPNMKGAVYRRYGELQYISIPDTSITKKLKLDGYASGSFTLDVEHFKNGASTKRQTYSAISVSTSSEVTAEVGSGPLVEDMILLVDFDGNGSTDISYNTNGEVLTYNELMMAINNLTLKPIYKKILLETARVAQLNFDKSIANIKFKKTEKLALEVLKQQVILYGKLRLISVIDQQRLLLMIDNLLNK